MTEDTQSKPIPEALAPTIARVHRPIFRRTDAHVFVKHSRLSLTEIAKPGDAVPDAMRSFQRKNLYRRGIIGVAGHPWTEAALERAKQRAEEALMAELQRETLSLEVTRELTNAPS